MIVLEFRFPKYFWNASRILEKSELQFRSQHSLENCCSNFIWFFEEDLRTTAQREALKRARALELDDQRSLQHSSMPTLGVPF